MLWRTAPMRLLRLIIGLWIFGVGDAMIVLSGLGNSPWTVLAEGLAVNTRMTIGLASIVVGAVLFAIWVPLRVRPGLGTVLNVFLIGIAIDVTLATVAEPHTLPWRIAVLLGGVATIGLGSGLYLGTRHGPGPRDGLMTGLHRATGWPIAVIRGLIEAVALTMGWLLGGTLGIGTLVFALLIGPAVHAGLAVDDKIR